MINKLQLLTILLFLLAFGLTVGAQSLQQTQNGTITVRVLCNCQLTATGNQNQPLHFTAIGNGAWRDTKHVRISSNCRWNLRVVSSKTATVTSLDVNANLKSKGRDRISASAASEGQITYTLQKTGGTGNLVNPSAIYILNQEPSLPEGLGELELDVVFEMIVADPKKGNPGNDNTWVSFYVLPKE
jgi:hypothetical protein